MKVSIIIPVYQVEAYLEECLQSVLAQTVSDYEVILVDDGSPDGCGAICDSYAARYSNFRVIHKKNGGLSSARNAGLDIAAGEYIYFLDSDDTMEPELLQTVLPAMDAGAQMVCFRFWNLEQGQQKKNEREMRSGDYLLKTQEQRFDFLENVLIPCRIGWEAWSRIFSGDLIRKYGLRFEDNRKIFAEDLYFSLCYCAHAEKIVALDQNLYNYRIRGDSIMGVQKTRSNLGRVCALSDAVLRHYSRFDDCTLLKDRFDSIYYHLVAGQFTFQMWVSGIPPLEYRELVREEVKSGWDEMEQQLRTYLSRHRSVSRRETELRANVLFLLGGSEFALRLRCRILRLFKEKTR